MAGGILTMFTVLSKPWWLLSLTALILAGLPTDRSTAQNTVESRCDALREEVEAKESRIKAGTGSPSFDLMAASSGLLQARLDLTKEPKDRIAAYEKYITLAKEIEARLEKMSNDGQIRPDVHKRVRAARLAGEIDLMREKAGGKPSVDQIEGTEKLLEARRDALREEVGYREGRVKGGLEGVNLPLLDACGRLLQAELELTEKPADRIALHQKYVEMAMRIDETLKCRSEKGRIRIEYYLEAKAARLEAEIGLLREQMK
jgi:hypothetical protein